LIRGRGVGEDETDFIRGDTSSLKSLPTCGDRERSRSSERERSPLKHLVILGVFNILKGK
jgi:hypothetical protein